MVAPPPSHPDPTPGASGDRRPFGPGGPLVSMILVTDDRFETIRRSTGHMRAQTLADRIELVIVCPSRDRLDMDEALMEPFGAWQVVETGEARSTGYMQAAGVRAARTSATCYIEEHNFPPANLAEAIIRDLVEQDRSVVGFSMGCANPSLVSWAHLYGQFGPSVAPVVSGMVRTLAGHHVAYRRALLMEYEACLTDMLNNEAVLHENLRRRGIELYMCGEIVVPHVQVSRFFAYARTEFIGQRGYGAARAQVQNWSWARRLLYVAGSPLIPFLRLWRSTKDIIRSGRSAALLPQVLPVMFAANVCGAVGEATGYLIGAGARNDSASMEIELDRYAFVTDSDRAQAQQAQLADPAPPR